MKQRQKEEALELTQKIMTAWYGGNPGLVEEYLDSNVVWIGSLDKQFYVGYRDVLEGLRSCALELLPCTLTHQSWYLGTTGASDCLCIGRYIATLETSNRIMQEPQRVTFTWHSHLGRLSITHIHVSNVAAITEPEEEFPIKASRKNYEYVQRKLLEKDGIINIQTTDFATRLLSISDILYVEARGANIIIHYATGACYKVHAGISEFLEKKCPDFLRVHRSYAVNPYHIKQIAGQTLILDNDEELIVPRPRLAELREELDKRF